MAFGEFNSNGGQPMAEINMTPMVDVMLVLLIIFMVTAPLMQQAIKVDLPKVNAAAVEQKPETIRITLKADGQIYWNDTPLEATALSARFASAAQQNPQPEVQLAADKESRYEKLAIVMGSAREAGITKLGFITEPAKTKP